jgi:hypothetical protein
MGERCSWCNTDPDEAAARHEGPHLTWCPHFRNEQRRRIGQAADTRIQEATRFGLTEVDLERSDRRARGIFD